MTQRIGTKRASVAISACMALASCSASGEWRRAPREDDIRAAEYILLAVASIEEGLLELTPEMQEQVVRVIPIVRMAAVSLKSGEWTDETASNITKLRSLRGLADLALEGVGWTPGQRRLALDGIGILLDRSERRLAE